MSAQRSQDLLAVHKSILTRCFYLVKEVFKNGYTPIWQAEKNRGHVRCPLPPFDPRPSTAYTESEVES